MAGGKVGLETDDPGSRGRRSVLPGEKGTRDWETSQEPCIEAAAPPYATLASDAAAAGRGVRNVVAEAARLDTWWEMTRPHRRSRRD